EFKATPLVSYWRGRTFDTSVTSSNLKTKTQTTNTFLGSKSTGMNPCLVCNQCLYVLKGKEFVHPRTGQSVKLRGYYTSITKFAIYVLTCQRGLIYIGETTQMVKLHISQHRSSINLVNMTLPVSKNFLKKGHTSDQLKFMVLENVPPVLENVPPLKTGGNRELKFKKRKVWWLLD
ncbi:hypothetical protein XELAEV_18046525mg, partial [Xenopus laevis]